MTAMYRWMEQNNYKFSDSLLSGLEFDAVWLARKTPLAHLGNDYMINEFPTYMRASAIEVVDIFTSVFDRIEAVLISAETAYLKANGTLMGDKEMGIVLENLRLQDEKTAQVYDQYLAHQAAADQDPDLNLNPIRPARPLFQFDFSAR